MPEETTTSVASQPTSEERAEQKFKRLAEQWRRATMFTSSGTELLSHEAYLKIIGMGQPALPFILRELKERGGYWFLALRSITEENPVPPEDAGKIQRMTEAWVLWGRQKGYL